MRPTTDPTRPLRVLVLEDDAAVAELVANWAFSAPHAR